MAVTLTQQEVEERIEYVREALKKDGKDFVGWNKLGANDPIQNRKTGGERGISQASLRRFIKRHAEKSNDKELLQLYLKHTDLSNKEKEEGNNPVVFFTDYKNKVDVKRPVFISVQHMTEPNRVFLDRFKQFIKEEKRDSVFVIPMFPERANFNEKPRPLPSLIAELEKVCKQVFVVDDNFVLNENAAVINVYQYPQAKDPLRGLDGFARGVGITVVGGTKLALRGLAKRGPDPAFMCSTGALTEPNYLNSRVGAIAKKEHNHSFVYLDITDSHHFSNLNTVEYKGGSGKLYYDSKVIDSNGVHESRPYAVTTPDIHASPASMPNIEYLVDEMKEIKMQNIFSGDVFDGESVSRHNKNDILKLVKRIEDGVTIKSEIGCVKRYFKLINDTMPNTIPYCVRSNHDQWLDIAAREHRQYFNFISPLDAGTLGLMVHLVFDCGVKNLLEFFIKEENKRVAMLGERDNVEYKGVILSMHGHDGVDGARGSNQSYNARGLKINKGHDHKVEIRGGIYSTGTCLPRFHGYSNNTGLSTWGMGLAILHKNGTRQMKVLWRRVDRMKPTDRPITRTGHLMCKNGDP